MRVLVVLFAAIACTVASPAAVSYAYSAISPLTSAYPYAAAYSPFAYAAAPVAAYSAAPAVVRAAPVVPAASPIVPYAAAPVPAIAYAAPAPVVAAGIKSQYHAQDEFGQASYGHAEPAQAHHAVQDAAGNKVGSFSFINPEGKFVQTNYVADAAGYRVASNDLPVAPVHHAVQPAPVVDTPEVAAAKAAHLVKLAEEASRSKRSITPAATTPIVAAPAVAPVIAAAPYAAAPYAAAPYAHAYGAYPYGAYPYAVPYATAYPHAYPTSSVVPVTTPQGYNADTPEVAAAKANHFAEHAAARARTYGAYPFVY